MNISKLKVLGTRIICGVLTASMLFSMGTTALAANLTSTEPEPVVDEPVDPNDTLNNNGPSDVDQEPEEDVTYSDPLVLDRSAVVFRPEETTVRVKATITDVRYLGALTSLEEFASFFPGDLDLSQCKYLTSDLKEAIGQMDEDTRRSYRGQAMGRLDVTERFDWSTIVGEYDYKDYLTIEVVSYSVRDASVDMAPSISCNVDITWTGPLETEAEVVPVTGSQGSGITNIDPGDANIQDLLNSTNNSGATANKNPLEESQEVQDLLYEMYKNEGLTQENTMGYDLSYFDERLKADLAAEGKNTTSGGNTTDVDLEAVLGGQTQTPVQDTGFSLITTPTTPASDDTINNKVEDDAQQPENGGEGTVTLPAGDEANVTAGDGQIVLDLNDTELEPAPEPDPVVDQKVEPPLEADAVPLDAPGGEEDAAGLADQDGGAAPAPEAGDGQTDDKTTQDENGQAGKDQAGDLAAQGGQADGGDQATANNGQGSSDQADNDQANNDQANNDQTPDSGLTLEQLLQQLGATNGGQQIVPQQGGEKTPFTNYEWKLTRDENNLYPETDTVQTAVLEPTIDASGNVVYEAWFAVSVPGTEMSVHGMGLFFGSATVPDLPDDPQTDIDDPNKTPDDGEKNEDPTQDDPNAEKPTGETPDLKPNEDQTQGTPSAVNSNDPDDATLLALFNLQDQGPGVDAWGQPAPDLIYYVRVMMGPSGLGTTRNLKANLDAALKDANWAMQEQPMYSVLDPRVAAIDDNGLLTAKREGRTAVYAMGYDANGQKVYAVLQLEVRGRFTLSSGAAIDSSATGYSLKMAVPMVSSGNLHSLALKADGSVWGWGSAGNTNALGSANGGVLRSPAPIYLRSSNGIYTPLTGAVMVAAGLNYSLALTAEGNVYAWGTNSRGQTGIGEDVTRESVQDPTFVKGPMVAEGQPADPNTDANGNLCHIVAIAAGANHALALAADGTVYAWGEATFGQLGVKPDTLTQTTSGDWYSPYPVVVRSNEDGTALSGIVSIAAGGSTSIALGANGKVYTWGDNRRGQLGQNLNPTGEDNNENYQRDVAEELNDYAVRAANEWSGQSGFGGVVAVSAGGAASSADRSHGHMLAIQAELGVDSASNARIDKTSVFGWGENDYGQVGDNSSQPATSEDMVKTHAILPTEAVYRDANTFNIRTVTVSAGIDHSLSVAQERPLESNDDRDNTYYTYGWGYDARGQLAQSIGSGDVNGAAGGGASSQKRTPTRLLSENYEVDADGKITTGELKYVTGSVGVSAGDNYSILWDENGEVFGTGYNFVYQLGASLTLKHMTKPNGDPMADNDSVAVPVRVGASISQNLIYDKVWVFTTMTDEDTGETSTQLTARYAVQPETVPVQGEPGDELIAPNVASIPVSKLNQMDPTENDENLMELTDDQFAALQAVSLQYGITLTDQQYAVVFKSGMKRYYSVGFNISERDRAVPSPDDSEMIYGHTHTDEIPNLDITDTKDHQEPWANLDRNNAVLEPTELKDVSAILGIVEDARDVDINGVYAGKLKVTIEDANNFATPMVRTGENFTVALKSDGTVWAWGDNTYGQLGTGKTFEELPYAPYPVRVTGLGTRTSEPVMARLTLIKEISAGFRHAMARTADGSVYVWGDNSRGQLGQNEEVYSTYEVYGDIVNVVVDQAKVDALAATSSCYPIQVTAGASGDENGSNYLMGATSIAAGGYHSMAVVGDTGWVYTWGDNSKAQLGTGYKVTAIGDIRTYPDRVVRDINGETNESKYLTSATEVAGGGWHSLAIGPFPYANTGSGSSGSDATYVAAWGDNTYGQLGIGPHERDEDGTRYGVAVDYMRQYSNTGEGTGILVDSVIQIGAGFYHTAVLTEGDTTKGTGGRVMVAGDYRYGQLGRAASADQNGVGYVEYATALVDDQGRDITDAVGVAAGQYHTAILRGKRAVLVDTTQIGPIIESTIYTFGTNTDGQLVVPAVDGNGYYQTQTFANSYQTVTKPANVAGTVTSLAAGGRHTVALTDLGEVFAWGKNESGQLGEMSLVDRSGTSQSGFDDAYIPAVSGVVNYGGSFTYDVRMETHQNNVLWNKVPGAQYNDCDYRLVQNTPKGLTYDLVRTVEDASYTDAEGNAIPYYTHYDAQGVAGGSYNIWSKEQKDGAVWKNTGTEVKVSKGVDFTKTPAVIDFFTVQFGIQETGGNSSITGEYTVGGETSTVQSGDSVWGGGKLVIHAVGMGGHVPDYDYQWTVTPATTAYTTERKGRWQPYEGTWTDDDGKEHTGGFINGTTIVESITEAQAATMDGFLTVESLGDQVNILCAVNHPQLFDVTVNVRLDKASWQDSDRQLFLKSDYQLIRLTKTNGSNAYKASDVPEGTYAVWEYVDGAFADATSTAVVNWGMCYQGPKTVTIKGGNATDYLDYYTLNAVVSPVNGVSAAELSVYYAELTQVDGEDHYGIYTGGVTGNAAWKLNSGDVVMANAPIYMTASTVVSSGVIPSLLKSSWRNSTGGTVTGLEAIDYREATTDGRSPLQIMKATGRVDLVVTIDGNVSGDTNYMVPMAVQLKKNDVNWAAASAAGYEVYLESVQSRVGGSAIASPARTWASYKLTHRGDGLFDTSDLGGTEQGGVPRDTYMVYLRYPNGVKLPIMGSQFTLSYRGYIGGASTETVNPAVTPLALNMREVNYQVIVTNDNSVTGMTSRTQAHVQIISGFSRELVYDDGVNAPILGKNDKGLILVAPDQQAPEHNVTVLQTIDVMAKADGTANSVSGTVVLPANNTVSIQIVGSHAQSFIVLSIWNNGSGDSAKETEVTANNVPLGYPVSFSTDANLHENFANGGDYADMGSDPGFTKPVNEADPWNLSDANSIRIRVSGANDPDPAWSWDPSASLSSLDELEVQVDELLTGYDVFGELPKDSQAQLSESTGGATGTLTESEVIVPGRELANWNGGDKKLSDLTLGNYLELVTGDTVDIVGTTEKYLPDYRLAYTPGSERYYRNVTPDAAGKTQPYIDIPAERIVVGTDELGNDITEVNPERYALVGTEKDAEGNDVPIYEDLWGNAELVITSSDPSVVRVEGYTLTAGEQNGKATVRIYNKLTNRSSMIVVHVLNVEDAAGEGKEREYAYKSTPMIALGENFSVALKADGTVWTWGDNTYGQLGINNAVITYSDAPMAVRTVVDAQTNMAPTIRHVVSIAAGARHAAALTREGVVYVWGDNTFGQFALDPKDFAIEDTSTQEIIGYGSYSAVEADISGVLGKIVEIAAGNGFTVARTERNTVWAWGRNDKGQLGVGYVGDVFGHDPVREQYLEQVTYRTTTGGSIYAELCNFFGMSSQASRFSRESLNTGHNERFEADPYYLDSYYLYAKYLYDMVLFAQQQERALANPANLDDYYIFEGLDHDNGILDMGVALDDQFRGNEMATMDEFVLALELYDAGESYLRAAYDRIAGVNEAYATEFDRFVPLGDKINGAYTYRTEWKLERPTYSGVKWSCEDYETALAQYQEREKNGTLVTDGGIFGAALNNDDGRIVMESAPTYNEYVWTPVQVMEGQAASKGYYLSEIMSISAGDGHVMALRSDGSLFGWGDNTYGQLGTGLDDTLVRSDNSDLGATFTYRVPVRVKLGNTQGDPATQSAAEMKGYLVNVMTVAAGGNHTLALLSNGTVVAFGENTFGQTGNGSVVRVTYDIKDLKAETPETDGVDAYDLVKDTIVERRVAQAGQVMLGNGALLGGVTAIAAGGQSSEAIVRDAALSGEPGGTVYAWGSNMTGQLGLDERQDDDAEGPRTAYVGYALQVLRGDSANSSETYQGFTRAIAIAVGGEHMAAVRADGYVWNWGRNHRGQLGNGTRDNSFRAVQAGDGESKSLLLSKYEHYDQNDQLLHTYNQLRPMGEDNPNIVMMDEKDYLLLDLADILYSHRTGFNLISDGENTSIADKLNLVDVGVTDPSIFTAEPIPGGNKVKVRNTGKLGLTSVYLDYEFSKGTETDPQTSNMMVLPVWAKHRQTYDPGQPADDHNVTVSAAPMVAAGAKHTVALDSSGRVWVWGDNSKGQLALDPELYPYVDHPVQVTNFYRYDAERPDNTDLQLALDGGPLTFSAVAAGKDFTYALDADGYVWAWGNNYALNGTTKLNQLGRGADNAYQGYQPMRVRMRVSRIGTLGEEAETKEYRYRKDDGSGDTVIEQYVERDRIVAIAAGESYGLALSMSGFVYSWGDNANGQMGISDRELATSAYAKWVGKGRSPSQTNHMQEAVSIAAGGKSGGVLFSNGTLFTFGDNAKGQLGDGTDHTRYAAVKVQAGQGNTWNNGSFTGNAGMNPNDAKDYNFNKGVAIAMGAGHTTAIALNITMTAPDANGKNFVATPGLYGWGDNASEQFGVGLNTVSTPDGGDQVVHNTFSTPVRMTDAKGQAILAGARQLSAGYAATLAQVENQTIKNNGSGYDPVQLLAWGDNSLGQLGNYGITRKPIPSGSPVDYDNTVAREVAHELQVIDDNYHWMQKVMVTAVGGDFIVFARDTGTVFAAGSNALGQLGDYTEIDSEYPVVVGRLSYESLIAWGTDHNTTPHDLSPQITLVGAEQAEFDLTQMAYLVDYGFNLLSHKPLENIQDAIWEFTSLDESITVKLSEDATTVTFGPRDPDHVKYGDTFIQIYEAVTGRTLLLRVKVVPEKDGGFSTSPMLEAGKNHIIALKADGSVWAWGDNAQGQLGDGTFVDRAYPVEVKDPDGKPFTNVVSVAAGDNYSVVLRDSDGDLATTDDREVYVVGGLSSITTNLIHVPSEEELLQAERHEGPKFMQMYRADGTFTPYTPEQVANGEAEGKNYVGELTRAIEFRKANNRVPENTGASTVLGVAPGQDFTAMDYSDEAVAYAESQGWTVYYLAYYKYVNQDGDDCGIWVDIPKNCPNPKLPHTSEFMSRVVNSNYEIGYIGVVPYNLRSNVTLGPDGFYYTTYQEIVDGESVTRTIKYDQIYDDKWTGCSFWVSKTAKDWIDGITASGQRPTQAEITALQAKSPTAYMMLRRGTSGTPGAIADNYAFGWTTRTVDYFTGQLNCSYEGCTLQDYNPADTITPVTCGNEACELTGQNFFTMIYEDAEDVWAQYHIDADWHALPENEESYRIWRCQNNHVWIAPYDQAPTCPPPR